jgi:hypothetical protein
MNEKLGVLSQYRSKVNEFIKKNGSILPVVIDLSSHFLRKCEERIVAGAVKYGDDWKVKNCLKEREYEVYDYFNYTILDLLQKDFKKKVSDGRKSR